MTDEKNHHERERLCALLARQSETGDDCTATLQALINLGGTLTLPATGIPRSDTPG